MMSKKSLRELFPDNCCVVLLNAIHGLMLTPKIHGSVEYRYCRSKIVGNILSPYQEKSVGFFIQVFLQSRAAIIFQPKKISWERNYSAKYWFHNALVVFCSSVIAPALLYYTPSLALLVRYDQLMVRTKVRSTQLNIMYYLFRNGNHAQNFSIL